MLATRLRTLVLQNRNKLYLHIVTASFDTALKWPCQDVSSIPERKSQQDRRPVLLPPTNTLP